MEHAEAHERLADLALEPARLRRLEAEDDATSAALRAHVSGCDRCSTSLAGWLRTWDAMAVTRTADETGGSSGDPEFAWAPPARLRSRTLAAVRVLKEAEARQLLQTAAPGRPRMRFRIARLALAAAAVLAFALVGVVAVDSRAELDRVQTQNTALASTTAALDRILAAPTHSALALQAADGSRGGTVLWSSAEFVVLTSRLQAPPAGQQYRCWIQNGDRSVLGALSFDGSVGSWSGSMSGWESYFVPGAQLGVSLYSSNASGDADRGQPVLVATFPSS